MRHLLESLKSCARDKVGGVKKSKNDKISDFSLISFASDKMEGFYAVIFLYNLLIAELCERIT